MEYNKRLYESLQQMVDKYDSLNRELEDPAIPVYKVTEINKQIKRIQPIKDKFVEFKKLIDDGTNDEKFLDNKGDIEMQELARMELDDIKPRVASLEEELKLLLLPADPYNEKNIIMEMRPAVGGDESSIFTADLFETYKNYCERQG
jgi:peptide chain release factor 1